ncbi:hypothetical protein D3C71_1577060 [compost metagenome]
MRIDVSATEPDAPGRFSMMTGWLSSLAAMFARLRRCTSVEPPGGNGTTRVMGFSGKAAVAGAALAKPQTADNNKASNFIDLSLMIGSANPAEAAGAHGAVVSWSQDRHGGPFFFRKAACMMRG